MAARSSKAEFLSWFLALVAFAGFADERPNIVLIMADDLGYECIGAYGGRSYKTPHIDELAATGTRFTNCFSTPKCSPSRVTILTGRYTIRSTMKWGYIPPDERTFGHQLSDAGYATALAGKWQLGLMKKQPDRVQQAGFQQSMVWAWHEGPRYWQPMAYHSDRLADTISERYGPDVYCDFLINFMRKKRDTPFLAYFPLTLPHFPKRDEPKGPNGKWESFKEMVENMDDLVGRIVQALDDSGQRENTLILFTADNGTPTNVTSMLGDRKIKGGKAKLTDDGTRVPLIANWPGVTPVGSNDDLIDFTDFLPTLCELSNAKLPADRVIDGHSFAPQLRARPNRVRNWVFTEWAGKRWIRDKDWKLYASGKLYDMRQDNSETKTAAGVEADAARARLAPVLAQLLDSAR